MAIICLYVETLLQASAPHLFHPTDSWWVGGLIWPAPFGPGPQMIAGFACPP